MIHQHGSNHMMPALFLDTLAILGASVSKTRRILQRALQGPLRLLLAMTYMSTNVLVDAMERLH
jgi:hypothetical protein